MKFRALSIFATILFCTLYAQGQNIDLVESHARKSLTEHFKKYPEEKVFVHTDAGLYANGHTIWYKAYVLAYGKPSELSSIVYVVLADSIGNTIIKNKLRVKGGRAYGNIELPDSLRSGWYQLIGFTAWTMNFGEAGAYHKKIYIQNPAERVADAGSAAKNRYHITFYPEGGDPVEGALCNFAFKAWDVNGRPVNVEGEVLNDEKKAIARLKTVHYGMGSFEIEGSAGHRNVAMVVFPDKSVQTIYLPDFKMQGLVLKVNPFLSINLEVRITLGANAEVYQNVVLAAFQDNGTFNTYPLRLSEGINVVNIKKKDFSTGILRLTLFNQQGIPEAERITFINNSDQLKLSLIPDSISFNARSKTSFKLSSLKARGKNVSGNFSVSVTDADAIGEDEAGDSISSYFLMSSELQEKIYHPAYYFKNNSDTLQRHLDLVMLTNGWRHFRWNKDTIVLKNPVEKSQFIAGRIMSYNEQLNNKNPLRVKLVIQNQDSTKYFAYVEPDSAGRFIIRNYNRAGTASILMQAVNKKDRIGKFKVSLYSTYADSLQAARYSALDSVIDTSLDSSGYFIANAQKERQQRLVLQGRLLKTVNIREKKLTPTDELIQRHVIHFPSDHAQTLDLINTPSTPSLSILDYILGKFTGLQIMVIPDLLPDYNFVYHGPASLNTGSVRSSTDPEGSHSNHPVVYIDEGPSTFSELHDLPITDVALIRFIPPPVWFAPLNGGQVGALMIYTKRFGDERNKGASQFDSYTFNGYSITREFAAPDYSIPKATKSADNRTTLYWNHDLDTRRGEANFSFYNSDNANHFRVIIQGMDADGRIGYLEQVY